MAEVTILENLESIMRGEAAFPFDARITQIFTNTVNVKPVGSRTILRDVALPEHIKVEDLKIGYPVRLGQSGANITVTAVFKQFADDESINYAGLGSKIPAKPVISVQVMKDGWHVRWPKVDGATKYLVFANNTPDGDSPELIATLPATTAATYDYVASYRDLAAPFRYFAVQAWSGLLEGDVSLWLTDETPPANPAWVSDTFQEDGHHLKWSHSNPNDVMEFVICRNSLASETGMVEVGRTNKLELIAAYDASGDYFGVQAIDYSGLNKSAVVWSPWWDPTPATPTNFQANLIEGGGFICAWDAAPGGRAARYEVQGATDNQGTGATEVFNAQANRTGMIRFGGISWFRVRAKGWDGTYSDWSAWETDDNAPPQPVLAIVGGFKQVSVGLAAIDTSHTAVGFSHYVLETAAGSTGQNAQTLDSHATYESFPRIFSQAAGVTQYYRLTPYDWAGNVGTATPWTPAVASDTSFTIKEKWDTYGTCTINPAAGLRWLRLVNMEAAEAWSVVNYGLAGDPVPALSYVSSPVYQGTRAIKVTFTNAGAGKYTRFGVRYTWASSQNLGSDSRWQNSNDYALFQIQANFAVSSPNISLKWAQGDPAVAGNWKDSGIYAYSLWPANTWNECRRQKSNWAGLVTDWSQIRGVELYVFAPLVNNSYYFLLDTLDLVKDRNGQPDYVGGAWLLTTSTEPPK